MNITQTGEKVVIEMTVEEARDLEKACLSAKWYWQKETEGQQSADAKAVTNRIARKYHLMRYQLAEVIGW